MTVRDAEAIGASGGARRRGGRQAPEKDADTRALEKSALRSRSAWR